MKDAKGNEMMRVFKLGFTGLHIAAKTRKQAIDIAVDNCQVLGGDRVFADNILIGKSRIYATGKARVL